MREGKRSGKEGIAALKMPVILLAMMFLFFAADGPLGIALDLGYLCHSGDAGCPDRDSDGLPCGPDCPCSCCPGHRVMPVIASDPLFLATPALTSTVQPEDKTPSQKDIPFTIFRPPEA